MNSIEPAQTNQNLCKLTMLSFVIYCNLFSQITYVNNTVYWSEIKSFADQDGFPRLDVFHFHIVHQTNMDAE